MRTRTLPLPPLFLSLTALSLAASAAPQAPEDPIPVRSGAGLSPGSARPGQELPKPGGGTFFLDGHRNGHARELVLEEVRYGRLVEIHGTTAGGALDPAPVFRDFLVGESVQSDPGNYLLYSSPATQVEHLVVLRQPGAPEPFVGAGTFADLVRAAERAAVVLPPRAPLDALLASVPRNAAFCLRFSDLLYDAPAAALALVSNVRVTVGEPPIIPLPVRLLFDANHGGIAQGDFHSTRVLVDVAVSEFEANELAMPTQPNPLGLPPSHNSAAGAVLRLPTRLDPGSGQFTRLSNLSGRGLTATENGPIDVSSATRDLVRAARVANDLDVHSGFLLDLVPPTALGVISVSVGQASADPSGTPGFAFILDWTFLTPCAGAARLGDAIHVGTHILEVVQKGSSPDPSGTVHGVRVRLAGRAPTTSAELLGLAVLTARVRADHTVSPCWFGVTPQPMLPPGAGLSTSSTFQVRFSEPMRPDSFDPADNFRVLLGTAGTEAGALNTVVADLFASSGLQAYSLLPVLPLQHSQGTATRYFVEILPGSVGPTDLAGNALSFAPSAEVRIDRDAPTETSAGIVLRFSEVDEVPGTGRDLRGAIFYDIQEGTIRGRPATFFSATVDRNNPVPSIMIPFPPGVQSPLSPLGSKVHHVWRYCDFGWNVRDETKYDLDVVGLNWAPRAGLVISDFYEQFEIRLAHGKRLPDEAIDGNLLPRWPASGLVGSSQPFSENVLDDPLAPQKVVHNRSLGYQVDPSDLFESTSGTTLAPFPLNRGSGPMESYTWRDTRARSSGGPNGAGIPLDIESGPPLFLETEHGSVASAGEVPSIGLPLLVEYRCFPSDFALGLNAFDVSLAINSSARPAFRSYSTGGINASGLPVVRNPDLEEFPQGGFNPSSNPPGSTTPAADNAFYIGQIDLAHRVSRAISAWFDTQSKAVDYTDLRLGAFPSSAGGVSVEVRGATAFSGTGGGENDAATMDAYGELEAGTVSFLNDDPSWHADVDELDGARYIQLRLTFFNDLETGASPQLDLLSIAFRR